MEEEIRIGVDLHGVIDRNIKLFKRMAYMRHFSNIKIYVISGPPTSDVEQQLESIGIHKDIHYDHIATIVDFLRSQKDIEMWKDDKDTWWTSDENWWSAKAKICQELGISLMIDNTDRYKSYFEGTGIKFVLYDDME